jgi:hypothetical protein
MLVLVSLLAAAEGLLPTTVRAETRVAAALTPEAVWDAFNEEPKSDYYKPYVYPHPLQSGWEALMESVADSANATKARNP